MWHSKPRTDSMQRQRQMSLTLLMSYFIIYHVILYYMPCLWVKSMALCVCGITFKKPEVS